METARIVLGVVTAALLPHCLPFTRKSLVASLGISVAYGTWILATILWTWQAAVIFALLLGWSFYVWSASAAGRAGRPPGGPPPVSYRGPLRRARHRFVSLFPSADGEFSQANARVRTLLGSPGGRRFAVLTVCALVTVVAMAFLVDAGGTARFFHRLDEDHALAIVVSGLLAAVLVSHAPVTFFSTRFGGTRPAESIDYFNLSDPSIYIGWFERALIFSFIVAGQAEAAAMALAAKSIARYPAIEHNPEFGRYFIVGTFSSVLAGILWAVIVRLALGLSPM
ncbi:hypothetical protein SAMN04489712_12094 [Thermomonospora echinospora]|uniref:Uncharacterized protein n=1 Tax=Thermomonospora echinospora TaxID=1992 RepID=A0A1H6DQ20_9ACTN|nr:hypothetical protein SAMN04489712_12094 [Thermomonospora echinospora]